MLAYLLRLSSCETRRVLPSHGIFHTQNVGLNDQRNADLLPTRLVHSCVTATIFSYVSQHTVNFGTDSESVVEQERTTLVFRSKAARCLAVEHTACPFANRQKAVSPWTATCAQKADTGRCDCRPCLETLTGVREYLSVLVSDG